MNLIDIKSKKRVKKSFKLEGNLTNSLISTKNYNHTNQNNFNNSPTRFVQNPIPAANLNLNLHSNFLPGVEFYNR